VEHYVGIDVSLELLSVCVVDGRGKIVKEAKVASEPEALVYFLKELGFPVNRIGFEAGPLSQWLHAGLTQAGFEAVLLETRHVKAALSAMPVKTDRKDAFGLAQLLRMGWFQQVHAKSIGSQEIRALLVARKQLLGRLLDVELSIRGILRGLRTYLVVVAPPRLDNDLRFGTRTKRASPKGHTSRPGNRAVAVGLLASPGNSNAAPRVGERPQASYGQATTASLGTVHSYRRLYRYAWQRHCGRITETRGGSLLRRS
jgi:transposase